MSEQRPDNWWSMTLPEREAWQRAVREREARAQAAADERDARCAEIERLRGINADLLAACEAAAALLRRLGGHNHDPEYAELLAVIERTRGTATGSGEGDPEQC
jgi:hypothetical protein